MAHKLIEKQEVIDKALDNDFNPIPDIMPVETRKITRKEIKEQAINISPEEIKEIHYKLQYLAMLCDGAVIIDGQGFNKFDTSLGKSLAGLDTLTPKQAVLGRKMIKKYHGQLSDIEIPKEEE